MKTIGRYFIFIISLAGMTSTVEGRINDDIYNFLNDIFMLHNKYRREHQVGSLQRNAEMDHVAGQMLDNMFLEQYNPEHDKYGTKIHEIYINKDTIFNNNEAERIFLEWYKNGSTYNYFSESLNNESHNEFTQIVWRNTEWFGIAIRQTYYKYVIQIVYFPCGNIAGKYKTNVFQRPIIAHIYISPLHQLIYENDRRIFKDYLLYLHNTSRNKHRVQLLIRDEELDAFAYNILNLISNNAYQYNELNGNNYIVRVYDNDTILNEAEAEEIYLEWYNKGANYIYGAEPLDYEAAKFTQIVWRDTEKIGISMLREEGFYRVLVLYDPPGNIEGQFTSNVLRPQSMQQGQSSSHIDN